MIRTDAKASTKATPQGEAAEGLAMPWRVLVVLAVALALLAVWGIGPHLAEAQRATVLPLAESMVELGRSELQRAVGADMVFALGYGVLLWFLVANLAKSPSHSGRVRGRQDARAEQDARATVGHWAILGLVIADLAENALLWAQLRRFDVSALVRLLGDGTDAGPDSGALAAVGVDQRGDDLLQAMRIAGLVKWGLLTVTVIVVLDMGLRRRRGATGYDQNASSHRPSPDAVADWDPPLGAERRGVCLSGGGIRSASFSLGAMQALQSADWLDETDYLAAVSGGGYLAAGWAVSDAQVDDGPGVDPPAWSPRSPEERWFRSHSSYLVPDLWQGLHGVGLLLLGIIVNLALVWAVLYVGARPVGWLIHELHPELAPASPLTLPKDLDSGFTLGDITEIDSIERGNGGAAVEIRRFRIDIEGTVEGGGEPPAADSLARSDNVVRLDVEPFDGGDGDEYPIEQVEPGLVELEQGVLVVVRDPEVRAREGTCEEEQDDDDAQELCRDVKKLLQVTQQPDLTADDRPVGPIPDIDDPTPVADYPIIRDRLAIGSARIARTEPTDTRDDAAYPRWMWTGSLGLLGAGLMLGLGAVLGRSTGQRGRRLRYGSAVLAGAGLTWFVVLIGLPWLLDELPDRVSALTKEGGAQYERLRQELIVPAGGFLALAIAAVSQYRSANRAVTGKDKTSPSWWQRLRHKTDATSTELSWYELSPSKIFAGIAMVVVPLFIVVGQLQYAVANGWDGRLVGFAWAQTWFPYWLEPEIVRWGLLVLVLVGLAMSADAHSWSLHPFYKRRLQTAYLLERDPVTGEAHDLPYDRPVAFTPVVGSWPGLRRRTPPEAASDPDEDGPHPATGPQLVLCCAANLSEANRVPPGRRAASFTFSADVIGGPVMGWAPADEYWAGLSEARQRDITVPSAMSISGAAFSPAMGKANLGPVGAILAMANLRLGVWIPHPQWVSQLPDVGSDAESDPEAEARRLRRWWARRRPGWPWFFKELSNRYPFQSPYLYVSDGGHWDNLGLVELLRRGCTTVVCVNAGGDGQAEFGTIAEAIALAREELGVEITIDPSDLRPPLTAEAHKRELRRAVQPGEVEPFAGASFVKGEILYPATDDRGEVSGELFLIEPALTDDLPFDVHGFAESEAIFPDDSTADQVYNHRQFESFRRLGHHQAQALLDQL